MTCRSFLFALLALGLSGCSSAEVRQMLHAALPNAEESARSTEETWQEPAVTRVKIASPALTVRPTGRWLPESLSRRQIEISDLQPGASTVGDIITLIAATGVPVVREAAATGGDVLATAAPLTDFSGDLPTLLRLLHSGAGLAWRWDHGTLVVGSQDTYAVVVPQNKDLAQAIADSLKDLGADAITMSLLTGQVFYSVNPRRQRDVIQPFLDRASRNVASVTMRVAVVSLTNETLKGSPFDWQALALGWNRNVEATVAAAADGDAAGADDAADTTTASSGAYSAINAAEGLLSLDVGRSVANGAVASVAGAIRYLQTFGRLETRQDVRVHTLTSMPAYIRSGEETPYIEGVSVSTNTSGNNNSALGGTEIGHAKTGLTLEATPVYEDASQLVTVDFKLEMSSILRFVELSAGDQIGSLSLPVIQERAISDMIRVPAGQTAILGGLRYSSESMTGARLFSFDDTMTNSRDGSESAIYIILRPTVTVYELVGA